MSSKVSVRVALDERRGERTQLGERLDAREAAADDDDGEQAVARGPGGSMDALSKFDIRRSRIATASSIVLSPIALSAMPGIGNVRETAPAVTTIWSYSCWYGSPAIGSDRGDLVRVVDAGDLRGDDGGALEVATQGDDGVARLDRTGGDLGEERLVGHVRQRVDDHDVGLALAQGLLELPRGVEACVAATDDQDLGHGVGHEWRTPPGSAARRAGRQSDASDSSGDAERHQYSGGRAEDERQAAVEQGVAASAAAGMPRAVRHPPEAAARRDGLRRRLRQRVALGAPVEPDPVLEAPHRIGRDRRDVGRDGGRGIHQSVAVERVRHRRSHRRPGARCG